MAMMRYRSSQEIASKPVGAANLAAYAVLAALVALCWKPVPAAWAAESGIAQAGMPVTRCAALGQAQLGKAVGALTRIGSAGEQDIAGARYCVVEGTIHTAIHFEVRLPASGWSGRYVQTGCGGLCGMLAIRVEHAESCRPVQDHSVVLASTDMGHEGMGGEWAARNPATRADFGYRGVHLTALAAKALIRDYYGRAARYSYFSGCSDGGREALIEAQRYPQDFDGIAAGAPALNFTVQNSFYHAWNAVSNTGADGKALLTAADLPLLHSAVLAKCDALDGRRDGVIDDPRACDFDPAVLQCDLGAAPGACLRPAQVEAARRLYAGARDASGKRLVPGGPMPGSELAWEGVFVPSTVDGPIASRMFVQGSVPSLYYEKPLAADWQLNQLAFDEQTLRSFRLRGLYDATDPKLDAFRKRGGKLLMWHGWSDPHISPMNSIAYYEAVGARYGHESTLEFARLFLLPGVYHCGGGEGRVEFDVLAPLMAWVETGSAPVAIEQHDAHTSQSTYAYPDRASSGADEGRHRVPGHWLDKPLDWLGARFFEPDYELDCDSGLLSKCAGRQRK